MGGDDHQLQRLLVDLYVPDKNYMGCGPEIRSSKQKWRVLNSKKN